MSRRSVASATGDSPTPRPGSADGVWKPQPWSGPLPPACRLDPCCQFDRAGLAGRFVHDRVRHRLGDGEGNGVKRCAMLRPPTPAAGHHDAPEGLNRASRRRTRAARAVESGQACFIDSRRRATLGVHRLPGRAIPLKAGPAHTGPPMRVHRSGVVGRGASGGTRAAGAAGGIAPLTAIESSAELQHREELRSAVQETRGSTADLLQQRSLAVPTAQRRAHCRPPNTVFATITTARPRSSNVAHRSNQRAPTSSGTDHTITGAALTADELRVRVGMLRTVVPIPRIASITEVSPPWWALAGAHTDFGTLDYQRPRQGLFVRKGPFSTRARLAGLSVGVKPIDRGLTRQRPVSRTTRREAIAAEAVGTRPLVSVYWRCSSQLS